MVALQKASVVRFSSEFARQMKISDCFYPGPLGERPERDLMTLLEGNAGTPRYYPNRLASGAEQQWLLRAKFGDLQLCSNARTASVRSGLLDPQVTAKGKAYCAPKGECSNVPW